MVLGVRAEGRDGFLAFVCRILHTYNVAELLEAKEDELEKRLWAAVVALEEMVALLDDLAARGDAHGESAAARRAYEERAARAERHTDALRPTMNSNRPVDFGQSQTAGPPNDQP